MLTKLDYDIRTKGYEADLIKARNDWTKDKDGQAYLGRLADLGLGRSAADIDPLRRELETLFTQRMATWCAKFDIVGDVRAKGCLLGVELVKEKSTKEPFDEAGRLVYQKAFAKGLAWIPAGHILRMSPPIVMPEEVAHKGMDIIEEAIGETQAELG